MLPHRDGWTRFVRDAIGRLERAGVRVELGRGVDAAELRTTRPDVLVVATGAEFVTRVDAPDDVLVVDAAAAIASGVGGARHAVVLGSGAIGLGLAEWLQARGVRASVVTASAD